MAHAFDGTEERYYMDRALLANLDTAKKVIKQDWDMIFLYDGPEGSGKSVKAMQDAYYCDPTLNVDRITFNPDEFRNAVLTAEPYTAVIYDEAYTGLSARGTMTRINRSLVSMLAEIRQRNLFVFVVMPTYFDLDKYVALWRSRALVHVFTGEGFQRGYFAFYDADKKKDLYIKGKKFYSYSTALTRPNFVGRFVNHYPVDEKAYRRKKAGSLTRRIEKEEETERKKELEKLLIERVLSIGDIIPHSVKMILLDMKPATYYRRLRAFKAEEEGKDYDETYDEESNEDNTNENPGI